MKNFQNFISFGNFLILILREDSINSIKNIHRNEIEWHKSKFWRDRRSSNSRFSLPT